MMPDPPSLSERIDNRSSRCPAQPPAATPYRLPLLGPPSARERVPSGRRRLLLRNVRGLRTGCAGSRASLSWSPPPWPWWVSGTGTFRPGRPMNAPSRPALRRGAAGRWRRKGRSPTGTGWRWATSVRTSGTYGWAASTCAGRAASPRAPGLAGAGVKAMDASVSRATWVSGSAGPQVQGLPHGPGGLTGRGCGPPSHFRAAHRRESEQRGPVGCGQGASRTVLPCSRPAPASPCTAAGSAIRRWAATWTGSLPASTRRPAGLRR